MYHNAINYIYSDIELRNILLYISSLETQFVFDMIGWIIL